VLTLYIAPGSSSMAPHIALHEAGADFDIRPMSFRAREQRAPEYLAVNPQGKVPALVADGVVLTEVAAILFYIARHFPEARLMPPGDVAEARVLSWMSFLASTVHVASYKGGESARAAFQHAQQRLGASEWAVGGNMSVADIHLFRLFWRNYGRVPLTREDFPSLWAHHDRMIARPAVIKVCEIEASIGYELPS
jgi:glutathione S-transferase